MGKYDDAMYNCLSDNGRFADLFNGVVFRGEAVLQADALEEGAERYVQTETVQGHGDGGAGKQEEQSGKQKGKAPATQNRYRDIKKHLKEGAGFSVVAIESQCDVDHTIPWRIMMYDGLEYERQIRKIENGKRRELSQKKISHWETRFGQGDKLHPVYTICLYHGTKPWDGPKSLGDMMDFGADGRLREALFHDYRISLVCVEDLKDMSVFRTDLRLLLEALNARGDKQAMKALMDKKEFENISVETARTIAIMTDSQRILKKLQKYEDQEEVNMCRAWDEIEQEWEDKIAVAEEKANQAEKKANQAEKRLIETVIFDNLEEGKSEETIVAKLVRFFAMEPQEAEQCVRAYGLTL